MDQTVMVFAGTAARGSAIGTAVEGMVSFLEDSNALAIYDGSAWKNSLKTTGGILQVVTGTTTTLLTTTSSSYVTTGLTASITPLSTSSKIIVMASTNGLTQNGSTVGFWTIFRGTVAGTNLGAASGMAVIFLATNIEMASPVSCITLDSPNTASSQTYTLGFKTNGSGQTVTSQASSATATMILMEVAN
jgi:hypothetical protein